jgi:hypothetical protein
MTVVRQRAPMNIQDRLWPRPIGYLCLFLLVLAHGPSVALAQTTAHQPMTSATFVNIYWDSNWDSDNPTLMRGKVDAVTNLLINSTYLGSLSEYGVKTVTFAGSVLPNKSCPQVAPKSVGFYDPVNTQSPDSSNASMTTSLCYKQIILFIT